MHGPEAQWFEREFSFPFPVDVFPGLIARLHGTPAHIEELTRGSGRDILTRSDGRWSIQENVGHLHDLETLWADRMDDFAARRDTLTAADVENLKTKHANHDAADLDELLDQFRTTRMTLVNRLDALPAAEFARTSLHPRLQTPMRVVDLLFFVAEHDDHHASRIRQLRHDFGGRP